MAAAKSSGMRSVARVRSVETKTSPWLPEKWLAITSSGTPLRGALQPGVCVSALKSLFLTAWPRT
jgi:hypothetical protein